MPGSPGCWASRTSCSPSTRWISSASIAGSSPIQDSFSDLAAGAALHAIPLSALNGDNVVERSQETPWFTGAPLLEYLETVTIDREVAGQPFRFPVQLVLRPTTNFAGMPDRSRRGRSARATRSWCRRRAAVDPVKRIVTWDGDLSVAQAPMSVTLRSKTKWT